MSDTTIQEDIRSLGAWDRRVEKIPEAIKRAAKRADLDYWRAFDIWYGKARRVSDDERQKIAVALQQKNEQDARHELHDLKLRILRLEATLRTQDADFHRPALDHIGQALRPRR